MSETKTIKDVALSDLPEGDKIRYAIDRAIDMTLKEIGVKPKTRKSKVSMNYAITHMGVGRVVLERAIKEGKIHAIFNPRNKRWEVDRADVEGHFHLK